MRGLGRRWGIVMGALVVVGALVVPEVGNAATLYGLAGGGAFLVKFDAATPGIIDDAVAITGLQPNERIAGIDFRPRTGELMGVGVVTGATDAIRLYRIDALNGRATVISASSLNVSTGAFYGFGFNPTVDRIRVVNSSNENLRINPNNGARADAPVNDTDINPSTVLTGVAYDRSFDTGLAVANRTTLFGLSVTGNALVTIGGVNQSPSPNGGQVLSVGSLGVTVAGDAGFDIDLDGTGLAALGVGGRSTLHTVNLATGLATSVGAIGDGNLGVGGLAVVPPTLVAVAGESGVGPRVRVLDPFTGAERLAFDAFDPTMRKGVRVAVGDVTLDSVPEVIAATGKGVPSEVRVFDGVTGLALAGPLASFFPFGPEFKGGVTVAAGDVNADGNKDVIVGAGPKGGGHVRVFSGATGEELLDFAPFDGALKGGVEVASADFDLDGDWEIVVASGKGDASRVRVFDGTGAAFTAAALPSFVNDFVPYAPKFKGGVFVAAGDVNGDGRPDIVTGAGKGAPEIAVFSGVNGIQLGRFVAFDKPKSGVRVAVGDVDADGRYDVLAAAGSGKGIAVRAFDGDTQVEKRRFLAFDAAFKKGVFVAGVRR